MEDLEVLVNGRKIVINLSSTLPKITGNKALKEQIINSIIT